MSPFSTHKEVGQASSLTFKVLYGGSNETSLQKLCYQKFMNMSCSGIIQPEQAVYFHRLRTFIQIMEWRWKDNINAEDWDRRKNGDCLYPVKTNSDYAPSYLQKIIRCNKTMTTKNPCVTNKCSCRKHGLPCVSLCGGYCGKDSNNCPSQQESSQVACPEPLEFNQHGVGSLILATALVL